MKRRPILISGLILGLGLGLHTAFRGLSGELPRLFPRLAREERIAPPPSVIAEAPSDALPAGEEDISPPAAAAPLKKSGEVEPTLFDRKLLSPSRIPDFRKGGHAITERFEVTPALAPIVNFWKKIYGVYDSNHVVFHDTDHLEIEYGVLNFSDLKGLPDSEKKARRNAAVNAEVARIRSALSDLEDWEGLRPLSHPLSEDAQRISVLFGHIPDPDKYKKAKEAVRTQVGLKDRFHEAVRRSGRYLPLFQEVFAYYGVPQEITRLAFVESMFRERALSKVNAAGLWQFMADSAKKYMTVDPNLDERYDPVVATHGAARLLLKNYDLLGTWPLAINAYNSGPGNLQKAVQKLGTKDIGRIVTEFRTGSYAFASRNFYPSFLAALDIYENHERYFGRVRKEAPWKFDQIELPITMSFPEIASLSGASLTKLKELNPAYSDAVINGRFSLPAGSQIRLPSGDQSVFASRFVSYAANRVASTTTAPLFHIAKSVESSEGPSAGSSLISDDTEVEAPSDPSRILQVPPNLPTTFMKQ